MTRVAVWGLAPILGGVWTREGGGSKFCRSPRMVSDEADKGGRGGTGAYIGAKDDG
jgi:hypothetical protein